jgi:hypothetical protein
MQLLWRKIFQIPQTYLLLVGIILGLSIFLNSVGIRPFTLILGGLISLAMLGFWLKYLSSILSQTEANLLDVDNFLQQLKLIAAKLGKKTHLSWSKAETYAKESQQFCQTIVHRESPLTPELIETLYTVLDLSNQVVEAILALEKVQTQSYRDLAQEHLNTSLNRLQNTHYQLQQLQDQVLLSSLENPEISNRLPLYLQELINVNRSSLESIIQKPSENGDQS